MRYVKPLKEKISITIDEDILAEIKRLAEADDRSLFQYINMVLKLPLLVKKPILIAVLYTSIPNAIM